MLEIAKPTPALALEVSQTPGAFLWWYVDMRSANGDGLVLVWSLGLPFLPGSREANVPSTRPAMSLAHYQGGKQRSYLLQQYGSDEAHIDPSSGCGVIGKSRYEIEKCEGFVELRVLLDEPIAASGERLTGTIQLKGPLVRLEFAGAAAAHAWCPLSLHARGHADLNIGREPVVLEGSAYLDSNVSRLPLHDQEIKGWRWGRLTFPDMTLVYYELEESDGNHRRYIVRQTSDGVFSAVSGRLTFSDYTRGGYGLVSPRTATVETRDDFFEVAAGSLVEDGPFYQRFLVTAQNDKGQVGVGTAEVVIPGFVDRPWQRPFVRMRTHYVGRGNSRWLPLFSGPALGRAARLLRSLSGLGAAS